VTEKKLELYPAQEEAILELFDDRHVILKRIRREAVCFAEVLRKV